MTLDEIFLALLLVAMILNVIVLVYELSELAAYEKWFETFKEKMKGLK